MFDLSTTETIIVSKSDKSMNEFDSWLHAALKELENSSHPSPTLQKSDHNPLHRYRRMRFEMQNASALLLPGESVSMCLRHTIPGEDVTLQKHTENETAARLTGLQTCDSVWSCPVCAQKIAQQRAVVLGRAINHPDYDVTMATFTLGHHAGQSLSYVLSQLQSAYKAVFSGKAWQNAKRRFDLAGTVKALEVTHGDNGWHPHVHTLIVKSGEWDDLTLAEFTTWVRKRWEYQIQRLGGYVSEKAGCQVSEPPRGATERATYIAKMSSAYEMTKLAGKVSRKGGRTPMQLLYDYTYNDDHHAGVLFAHYAKTMKGSRHIRWSAGLKELLGVEEIEKRFEDEREAERMEFGAGYRIPASWWANVCAARKRADVINQFLALGIDDFYQWLEQFRPYKRERLDNESERCRTTIPGD